MTRLLDAALRFGLGVLLACAGLSAAPAAAAPADAPRAPEILDAPGAAAVRAAPSAPAALALVRAGFVRFDGRRSVPLAASAPDRAASPLSLSFIPAAPAAVRLPGAAPGVLSRGPPASA